MILPRMNAELDETLRVSQLDPGPSAGPSSSEWTNAELDEWFEQDVGGLEEVRSATYTYRHHHDPPDPPYPEDLQYGIDALTRSSSWDPFDEPGLISEDAWERLSHEAKMRRSLVVAEFSSTFSCPHTFSCLHTFSTRHSLFLKAK